MISFRRVLAEKRLAVTAVGLVVLANLLLYGLALQPARSGVQQARQRAAQALGEHAARQAELDAARARLAAMRRAREQLREFHAEVLPPDLARARALTYPRLAALAARQGLRLERRTSDLDQEGGAGLGRLQTTLQLEGGYGAIRRFIEEIETAPEFLIIDEVALRQREAAPGGALVVTLGVSTYFPVQAGAL